MAKVRRAPITTIADAARFVGITPGAPSAVYTPSTPLEPDAPLSVDLDAVEILAMWHELTNVALRAFAESIAEDEPTEAQLWPEHFDLAMSADRINYGGSPGDDYIDVPYLYVGPFEGRPSEPDAFWNQPFGAAMGFDEIATIQDAFEFFRKGRKLAKASRYRRNPTRGSAHPLAGIHEDRLSGDHARPIGQQERHTLGHVFVGRNLTERHVGRDAPITCSTGCSVAPRPCSRTPVPAGPTSTVGTTVLTRIRLGPSSLAM
jgi:hypothetical protein